MMTENSGSQREVYRHGSESVPIGSPLSSAAEESTKVPRPLPWQGPQGPLWKVDWRAVFSDLSSFSPGIWQEPEVGPELLEAFTRLVTWSVKLMSKTRHVLHWELRKKMKELEFKCQALRSSKSSVLSKWDGQGMWHVVNEESSGLIRGKGKQLTFFTPLGPEDTAKSRQRFFFQLHVGSTVWEQKFPSALLPSLRQNPSNLCWNQGPRDLWRVGLATRRDLSVVTPQVTQH